MTMSKRDLLAGLTAAQKEAVRHGEGPCLVVAGAGTGKTAVVTRRVAYLIQKKKARPEEVLALTFTEKAAAEMTTRIDELSDRIYGDLNVSTFHSFGAELISEFSYDLGLPADVRVLSDQELVLFIRNNIFEFDLKYYRNLSDPTSLISDLIKVFSRAKDEAVGPEEWLKKAADLKSRAKDRAEREERKKQLELAGAYRTYNRLLHENGYIDHGDQIGLILELLGKPSCAKKIRERYRYVLVDEFQDTNYAQNEVLKGIFGRDGNVMVAGDDDQGIFSFRGTSVSNILDFRKDYRNVKTIVLTDNFRSTQVILDTARRLIKHNDPHRLESRYKIDKRLKSSFGKGQEPELFLFNDETKEAEFVAQKIKEGVKGGQKLSDFAVLVRANRQAEAFLLALKANALPYIFSGAAGLYRKKEAKNLIALVSVLSDPEDDLSLFHLAASEIYGMKMDDLVRLSRFSKRSNRPLREVFEGKLEPSLAEGVSEASLVLAEKIIRDIGVLGEEAREATAGEVINLFLRRSGYYAKLTRQAREGSVEAHEKISDIAGFFDRIIRFQKNNRDHSLENFARYLELILTSGSDPAETIFDEGLEAVSVLSMHKGKGLEYDTVFVVSLSDSHLPARGGPSGLDLPEELVRGKAEKSPTASLSEERRLLYVAMTRARRRLYLSASLDYGTKNTHRISRFVIEALGSEKIEKKFLKTEPVERIRGFEKVRGLSGVVLEPISKSKTITLSQAAVDDYLTCPFKYQLIHVTPIRLVADARVAYGNAIHRTIGEYYKLRAAGKRVTEKQLIEWFDTFWDESGFLSRTHEKRRYEQGVLALGSFYKKAQKTPLPAAVEKDFRVKMGKNIIRGRYDAIWEKEKGTEVVDFKTADIKDQKKADRRTKESFQLSVYALAYLKETDRLPASVKLYFVDTGVIGSFEPTEKSVQRTEEKIERVFEGIRSREYGPTPGLNSCRYCPFGLYCPATVEKRS